MFSAGAGDLASEGAAAAADEDREHAPARDRRGQERAGAQRQEDRRRSHKVVRTGEIFGLLVASIRSSSEPCTLQTSGSGRRAVPCCRRPAGASVGEQVLQVSLTLSCEIIIILSLATEICRPEAQAIYYSTPSSL